MPTKRDRQSTLQACCTVDKSAGEAKKREFNFLISLCTSLRTGRLLLGFAPNESRNVADGSSGICRFLIRFLGSLSRPHQLSLAMGLHRSFKDEDLKSGLTISELLAVAATIPRRLAKAKFAIGVA